MQRCIVSTMMLIWSIHLIAPSILLNQLRSVIQLSSESPGRVPSNSLYHTKPITVHTGVVHQVALLSEMNLLTRDKQDSYFTVVLLLGCLSHWQQFLYEALDRVNSSDLPCTKHGERNQPGYYDAYSRKNVNY